MSPQHIILVGAGGHGSVVYAALLEQYEAAIIEVRADDRPKRDFFQRAVLSPAIPPSCPADSFVHIAVGDNLSRERLASNAIALGMQYLSVIHPTAAMALEAKIGGGSYVGACAVLNPYASIGVGCLINHGAVIDHDCRVGDWTHIAPNATLGGGAEVGSHCLIGIGAIILPGRKVGDGAVVGAGSVVTRDVAAGSTVTGIPAKAIY